MSDSTHSHCPLVEFDTIRLKLRSLCESDERLYCELYGDARTMRFIGPPLSLEQAVRSFRRTLASTRRHPVQRLILTVIDTDAQQAVGICGIQQFDAVGRRAEVGIMLKPALHARGFAKECLGALIAQAFAMFALDEIWAWAAADHCVAERLVIGVGFSPSDGPESDRSESDRLASRDGGPGRRVWSVYRESWSHNATAG